MSNAENIAILSTLIILLFKLTLNLEYIRFHLHQHLLLYCPNMNMNGMSVSTSLPLCYTNEIQYPNLDY
jgi:hypothetical protein